MSKFTKILGLSLCCFSQSFAATSAGNSSAALDAALKIENEIDGGVINFDAGDVIILGINPEQDQVRAVNSSPSFVYNGNNITINGMGATYDGSGSFGSRGFFIGGMGSSLAGSVTVNDLTFNEITAVGGVNGGMGAGGGIFVGQNTRVTLKDCRFSSCAAVGVGNAAGFFAGGMKGSAFGLGGGGFGGNSLGGGLSMLAGAGAGGINPLGSNFGPTPGGNFDGATTGSSGIGGAPDMPGTFGGGGGGPSDGMLVMPGGAGGFGGGGGTSATTGGAGGFGGAGGASLTTAGAGGFGGGGGGGAGFGTPGLGGFGGGDGTTVVFGVGAGFGGAIFIQDGGELTIEGSIDFVGNSASTFPATGNPNMVAAEGFGVLGQDIFMMSGSSIIFDITSDVMLQNPIEGNQGNERPSPSVPTNTGGLTKKGPSLLSLVGDNTYTGKTNVEEGELRINSSIVSNLEINGGTVSGNFSVKKDITGANGGDITLNSGRLEPGVQGVGTIEMEGVYTQGPDGVLCIDITPMATADFITGATSANLAGTMEVVVNDGNYIAGTQYLVIDAPVTGVFDEVIEVGQLGNLVTIDVSYSSVVITVLNSLLFETQEIDSGPPTDVVNCIRVAEIEPFSDFAINVEILGTLSNSEVNKALTSLSAVRYGALEWINARNNSYAADILSQHLFDLCCSPRDCCSCDCNSSGWVSVFGNLMNNQKSLDNLRRYNADSVGILAGVDSCCSDCFYYGGAFGYTRTHLLWRNNGGGGDSDSYYASLYGSWDTGCCFITDFSILGGGTFYDLKRKITFSTVDRNARSDFWGYFFTAHLGFRSSWEWCCSTFEPFALADYHYYTHEKFTEKGAQSLNLTVKDKDQHMMRGEAGLRWYYEYDCGNCCYAPYLGLSWVGEFPIGKSKQPASFKGQSCVIDALSYDSSVQLGAPQAGIKWSHCNGASFLLGYKGLFNSSVRINEIEGRLEWIF